MDVVKSFLNVTIQEAKPCVKDRREWRHIVRNDVYDPELNKFYEVVKT